MTPLIVAAVVGLVIVGGWLLWYHVTSARLGSESGVFKLVGIFLTPVIVFCGLGLALYAGIVTYALPIILEWIRNG